ncbi:MAG: methyltransferase domain-containing protein [Actinomycetota bacterium]|nr:methyltransferase domain-containing protein [Actinomycetota bacterium]
MTSRRPRLLAAAGAAGLAGALGGLWYRRYTTPFPYAQRWMLDKELPHLGREQLCSLLDPRPGERILEIGPGTGLFSLPVAQRVAPGGGLEILDIQQVMLEHTRERGLAAGITNINTTCGDARRLPYPDAHFHAAYMMTVLGEITDQDQALAELRRVLRADGRMVVGEFLIDWHAVRFGALTRRAARHGLRCERRLGPRYSYLARFAPG